MTIAHHYCTPSSFEKIVRLGWLLARPARYLDDKRECVLVIEDLIREMDHLIVQVNQPQRLDVDACKQLERWFVEIREDLRAKLDASRETFVTSFSDSDLLASQWNDCAGGGTGFALTVDLAESNLPEDPDLATKHAAWSRVNYGVGDRLMALVRELTSVVREALYKSPASGKSKWLVSDGMINRRRDLLDAAAMAFAVTKSPRYRAEQELRIIVPPSDQATDAQEHVVVRGVLSTVVPISLHSLDTPWPEKMPSDIRLPLVGVTLGPACTSEIPTVTSFLKAKGLGSARTRRVRWEVVDATGGES